MFLQSEVLFLFTHCFRAVTTSNQGRYSYTCKDFHVVLFYYLLQIMEISLLYGETYRAIILYHMLLFDTHMAISSA